MFSLNPASTLFLGTTIYPRQKCVCILVFSFSLHGQSGPRFSQVSYSVSCLSLHSNPIWHLKGNYCFLLITLLTPDVWGCFTPTSSLDTNWVSCSSVLTLTTWREHRPYELRAWSHNIAPTPGTRCKSQIVTCTSSDQPTISQGSHNPLFSCGDLLYQLTELSETLNVYWFIIKNIIKVQPDEEVHKPRSGRVPSTGASIICHWDASPSQHTDVLTNPEALQSL